MLPNWHERNIPCIYGAAGRWEPTAVEVPSCPVILPFTHLAAGGPDGRFHVFFLSRGPPGPPGQWARRNISYTFGDMRQGGGILLFVPPPTPQPCAPMPPDHAAAAFLNL